jgi:Kef-type K+ transport system membrane component KefB/mannitol/fructose-specific phosphotransferase system IIA component
LQAHRAEEPVEHLAASELTVMLLSLGVVIGTARLLGELARHFHQPAVLGELLAGVLLGPTVFGTLVPGWQSYLFPARGPNAVVLDGISSLAIVLFLLVAGMEVDLSTVWKQGRAALRVGVSGTIVPFAVGFAAAWLIPSALGRQVDADPLIFALFFATAMSISALPVIAKILMDLDLYRTDLGMVVVSAAVFNDLIGWTVFAVILGMIGSGSTELDIVWTVALTLAYAALMLVVGRWLLRRALLVLQAYTHWPGGVLGFAVTIALLGAAFTEFIGIHAIFGSFVVGVVLGSSGQLQERTRVMLDEFVQFIFAPVFFASIGLKVNFATHFDISLVILVLLVACVGKLAGAVLGARRGGMATRDAWAVGFAMNARGAMEIILGLLALEAGIIHQRLFVALVVMAIVTSAAGGPLISWVLQRRQAWRLLPAVSPKLFVRNMKAVSRQEAIHELAVLAAEHTNLASAELESLAWRREEIAATGIGHGVALPHARISGLTAPVVVVGISDGGVDFDAPDGQLAHVVFFIVTPLEDAAAQLELSANIAHTFRAPDSLSRVLQTSSFTEFVAILKTLDTRR